MGLIRRSAFLAVVLLALLFPLRATAAPPADDKVVFGGSYTLADGETLDGRLVVLGGDVVIEDGAVVDGDVYQLAGNVRIDGEVTGNVSLIGGVLTLGETAHLLGNLSVQGGTLERTAGAAVDGDVTEGPAAVEVDSGGTGGLGRFLLQSFWNLFTLFATSALAVVAGILWPQRLETMGDAIRRSPVMSGGVGLLVAGLLGPFLALIAITVILIPLSLLGYIALAASLFLGWTALGLAVGRRVAEALKQEWSAGLAAGAGALLLGIVYFGVGQVPCLGWAMQGMLVVLGFGAVVLTQFGAEPYLPRQTGF